MPFQLRKPFLFISRAEFRGSVIIMKAKKKRRGQTKETDTRKDNNIDDISELIRG